MAEIFESETLAPTERLIMLALADHADEAGRCYPSVQRLCRRTGLGERAVQTNIKKLTDAGYIKVINGGGRGATNLYFVSANPAANAPFTANKTPHEMRGNTLNPASAALNPAADAPEPSITKKTDADDARGSVRSADDPTFRERILDACKVDRSGMTGRGGQRIGTAADMARASIWTAAPPEGLGLSEADCIAVITETRAKMRGPPGSFKYFDGPMAELAAAKSAPPPELPATQFQNGANHERVENRRVAESERLSRILIAAAIGTTGTPD